MLGASWRRRTHRIMRHMDSPSRTQQQTRLRRHALGRHGSLVSRRIAYGEGASRYGQDTAGNGVRPLSLSSGGILEHKCTMAPQYVCVGGGGVFPNVPSLPFRSHTTLPHRVCPLLRKPILPSAPHWFRRTRAHREVPAACGRRRHRRSYPVTMTASELEYVGRHHVQFSQPPVHKTRAHSSSGNIIFTKRRFEGSGAHENRHARRGVRIKTCRPTNCALSELWRVRSLVGCCERLCSVVGACLVANTRASSKANII